MSDPEIVSVPLAPCEHNRGWWETHAGDPVKQDRILLLPCYPCMFAVMTEVAIKMGRKMADEKERLIIKTLTDRV